MQARAHQPRKDGSFSIIQRRIASKTSVVRHK
jgi:hypothetical protein